MNWTNVFQCEKDDWCRKVLAKNFPQSKQFADIKDFNGKEFTNRIDIISGGFPCQPFSVAGQRKGKDDDRYLWEEMLRVVGEIKPAYVVGENVTGIISLALDTVLSDLEAQDYTTETFIIPACSKNAWHRRDRVWIVAYANSIGRQDEQKENGQPIHNGNWNDKIKKQGRWKQQCRAGKSSSVFPNTPSSGQSGQGECSIGFSSTENGEGEANNAITNGFNGQWATEPGVGRKIDGFPAWLDRNINWLFISHFCIFVDGKLNNYQNGQTNKKRTEEVLQDLRSSIREAAFREWAFGGFDGFFTETALQSYLRKFEESINEAWLLLEGKETHQEVLRSLRLYEIITGTSYRPGQNKQRCGEYTNALQALSQFLAHNAKEAWTEYSRANAALIPNQWDDAGYWEALTPRVAYGIPDRMDRLKGLGNAIVPQVAYEIFCAIGAVSRHGA